MYQAIYKCRLCGEKFRIKNDKLYKEKVAVKKIWKLSINIPYTTNDIEFEIHRCQDGSLGLADFQGFKKSEE